MKYTVIDGERYEVKDCGDCPFRDMGDDGWNAHCTHPLVNQDPKFRIEIDYDGIAEGCPLKEVEGMNDREVLQALLDGKVIYDGWIIHPLIYRLNGKWMEDRDRTHGWSRTNHIPELDPDRVEIVEEEEWTQRSR